MERLPPHGWLIIDKPLGISSTFVGAKIKRILGQRKIGHAGTLDPFASGVLPLALGEATKTVPFIMNRLKSYEFTLAFGTQTTTDDIEGDVIATSTHMPDALAIEEILPQFIGHINQVPPIYAAIKIQGKPAYKRARTGEALEMPTRRVYVESLELKEYNHNQALFHITCGSGTYVRSLGRDISLALGTVGHLIALKRTKVGGFSINDAISLEKLEKIGNTTANCFLLPIGAVLDDIPAVTVSAQDVEKIRQGQAVFVNASDYDVAVTWHNDQIVALGKTCSSLFYPNRVFNI